MILITGRSISFGANLVTYTGYIYSVTRDPSTGAYSFNSLTIPAGVSTLASRPVFTMFPGNSKRALISGMFSPGAVVLEDFSVNMPGLPAPTSAPTIAAGSGTGLTGTYIGYVTFAHKINGVIVAESNPSPGSNTLALTNQDRSWTGIPTTCPNPRATHVRLYVSVAGADAKFAAEYAIGSSTAVENIADASLLETISERRGVPPFTFQSEGYHDRIYYGGDPQFPDRVWFSELNEPESVASTNFVPTRSGEAVTGLKMVRDQLLVTCQNCSYVIRGWDENDIQMEKVSPSVGCVASHSLVNFDETAIFLSHQGLYAYNGSMIPLMDNSLRDYFKTDYNENKSLYHDAFGIVDRETKVYKLMIPMAEGFAYVAYYPPFVAGKSEPWYGFDVRTRKDYTAGIIDGLLYTGSTDGYIRQENVEDDADDDGDTNAKTLVIRPRHETPDQMEREHTGYKWTAVHTFVKSESQAFTLGLFAGEEDAGEANFATYEPIVAAGQATGYVARGHTVVIPPNLSGSGVSQEYAWGSPTGVNWRGYELDYAEGAGQQRKAG